MTMNAWQKDFPAKKHCNTSIGKAESDENQTGKNIPC